jgi:hypothetical protein
MPLMVISREIVFHKITLETNVGITPLAEPDAF